MTINLRKSNYTPSFIRVAVLLLITMLFIQSSYADRSNSKNEIPQPEGFVLKKVNSHYEPVLHNRETVMIPGTNIKVGAYSYVLSNVDEIPKLGFLIDNNEFYYVKEESVACSHSDAHYGVFDQFFLVDGYAYGASHNRTMYLLKYTTNSVFLLDIISQAWVNQNGIDFATAYTGDVKYGYLGHNLPPMWTPISYFFYGYLSKNLNLSQIKKAMKSGDIPYQAVDLIENTAKWNAAFHADNQNFELIKYKLNRN